MSHIEHKQALAFMTICAEGSIRAAAEYLGIEPSTISRQIQALEKSMCITLIERGRKGIRTTEAGALLLQHLKRQQHELEDIQSEFDALRGMRRGRIIIALGEGFVSDFITHTLPEFSANYPGFTFSLQTGSTDTVLHALRNDQAHIGIAFNAPGDNAIRVIGETTRPLDLMVGATSALADLPETLDIRQLADLPFALLNPGFGVGAMVRDAEIRYGIHFQSLVETNSLTVLRNFVREGLGLTILPSFVVTREISDGVVISKSLNNPELHAGEVSVLCRSGRRLPEGALRLAQHVLRSMTAFSTQNISPPTD
ncbi:LysR family transcriptional regulator [Granulosicoccus sp. 3-233]|uniref:LysR family transcriptional regulator n=1 Tax=Granulosicoccus sp. 3-233 TaxID=3417969 RepID=UPI003D34E61D